MKKFKLIKEALNIIDTKYGSKEGFHYIILYSDGSGRITNADEPYGEGAKSVLCFHDEEHMIEKLRQYVKTNGFDEHPK